MKISDLVLSMRPRQWAKNLVLFAALLFSRNALDDGKLLLSLTAFAAFCLISSALYLVNDVADRQRDRLHPVKRLRPIASGALSPIAAALAAAILAAAALVTADHVNEEFALAVIAFAAIQLGYSWIFKNVAIVDVLCISVGFFLRAVAGALAIRVEASSWLILCAFFLALFLALTKRRYELALLGEAAKSHRSALSRYTLPQIDQMLVAVTAATIMSYALYTLSPETIGKWHTRHLFCTIPLVLYGIFRYLYLMETRQDRGCPEKVLYGDVPILMTVALYVLAVGIILYA